MFQIKDFLVLLHQIYLEILLNEITVFVIFLLFIGNHNKGNVPTVNTVKEKIKVVVSAPSYVSQTIKTKGEVFRSRIGMK